VLEELKDCVGHASFIKKIKELQTPDERAKLVASQSKSNKRDMGNQESSSEGCDKSTLCEREYKNAFSLGYSQALSDLLREISMHYFRGGHYYEEVKELADKLNFAEEHKVAGGKDGD
jgi:hypothetical protein